MDVTTTAGRDSPYNLTANKSRVYVTDDPVRSFAQKGIRTVLKSKMLVYDDVRNSHWLRQQKKSTTRKRTAILLHPGPISDTTPFKPLG
jgi:hypothetical protein